jgi:tRNA-specific 2-thiouridylase
MNPGISKNARRKTRTNPAFWRCWPGSNQNALFPLVTYANLQMRSIASKFGMHTAATKDSQSICLFDKHKIQEFPAQDITDSPAHIVTVNGKVVGCHNGLLTVTVAQRHGVNLPSNGDDKDYAVPCKDAKSHTMIEETESERSNPFYKNKGLSAI